MFAVLAFLGSTAGRVVIGVGLVLAVLGGAYLKGHSDGTAACQAKVDREVAAEKDRQRAAGTAALEADARAAAGRAAADDATAGIAQGVESDAETAAKKAACLSPYIDQETKRALESVR